MPSSVGEDHKVSGSSKKPHKVNALFRFESLQTSILLPFLVLISAAVIIFMLISVNTSYRMTMDSSTDYTMQLIEMANGDIDSYFQNLENFAQLIMDNSDTLKFMNILPKDRQTAESVLCMDRLEQQFTTLKHSRDDIYNIGLISNNGNYLLNRADTEINIYARAASQDWYRKAMSGEQSIVYSHVQNLIRGEYPWVVTLSRAVRDPSTGQICGILFIDMNYRSISSLCEKIKLGSKGYVFIIDETGTIVYHPKQQLLYSGIQSEEIGRILEVKNGSFLTSDKSKLYTVTSSDSTGCIIVGVADVAELMENSTKLQNTFVIIAFVMIAIATFISIFVANLISQPIRTLRDSMKEVERGDFNIHIHNPGYTNVIGDLIRAFNIMLERIKELIERIKDEQREKRKSELYALQAQINPHFLYNTLDSIIWMAEGKKMDEVILMTSALSKLLRKSISNNAEFVTVDSELGYVSEYLKIQKMRYHDKLDYSIEISPLVSHAYIAKLVIQPLVENAIYHGIKLKENGGTISIKGELQEDTVVITIQDDGVGMPDSVREHLFDDEHRVEDGTKVGVYNVNRRIKLNYGEQYGLFFESTEGVGTTVVVKIPYEEEVTES